MEDRLDSEFLNEEELTKKGYKKFVGENTKLDVFFNVDMCKHSRNCVTGNREVFNVDRRPWIMVDNANIQEVKKVIDTCPSGALKYIDKEK